MDIRNYAGFLAVAELLHVTQASRRLNITQSALTRQIQKLEEALGLKLFEKAGRNVRLTVAGEAMHSRIHAVLVADRDLRAFAGDLARDQSGLLKVGACSQLIERYLPRFLHDWRAANPGIDVHLEDGGGPELADKLRAGDVQLTISAMPATPIEMFQTVRLGQLSFVAVATPEFLTPDPGPVAIDALLANPILTLNARHASREVFDAACRLAGTRPLIVMESASPHTLFAMAEGGNGVAVVPSSARIYSDALVARPIALRGEIIRFDICAMSDSRAPLPVYGRRFVEDLQCHILAEEAAAENGSADSAPGRAQSGHLHIV